MKVEFSRIAFPQYLVNSELRNILLCFMNSDYPFQCIVFQFSGPFEQLRCCKIQDRVREVVKNANGPQIY